MGASRSANDGEFAIIGGTGDFAMARGILTKRLVVDVACSKIFELTVDGFCHMNVSILLDI